MHRCSAILAMCSMAATGCDRDQPPPAATTAGSVASVTAPIAESPPRKPPIEAFKLEPWKSPRKDVEAVTPPASLLQEWRVFVNQVRPRQRKNPKWRSLPAKESVTLDLADDGSFRCIVNPLRVDGRPNEELSEVQAWVLSRDLLCSADGWKTWTATSHHVVIAADGTETQSVPHAEALLRERIDGKARETVVIMRSDKDTNTTRRGPPEIIDAPQHID